MTKHDFALFGHLLSVVIFFSGIAVAAAAAQGAQAAQRAGQVVAVLRLARTGVILVGIGVLGVVGFGFWLLDIEPIGVGDGWVLASLGLLVASVVLGAIGGQAPKRARRLAEQVSPDDVPPPEVMRLLSDRLAMVANWASLLGAVAVLLLMIWKPGA